MSTQTSVTAVRAPFFSRSFFRRSTSAAKSRTSSTQHSPTVIAAAITSSRSKAPLPTHIALQGGQSGLTRDSIVLLEQMRTIDKRRLREKMGAVDESLMRQVDEAISISLGLK